MRRPSIFDIYHKSTLAFLTVTLIFCTLFAATSLKTNKTIEANREFSTPVAMSVKDIRSKTLELTQLLISTRHETSIINLERNTDQVEDLIADLKSETTYLSSATRIGTQSPAALTPSLESLEQLIKQHNFKAKLYLRDSVDALSEGEKLLNEIKSAKISFESITVAAEKKSLEQANKNPSLQTIAQAQLIASAYRSVDQLHNLVLRSLSTSSAEEVLILREEFFTHLRNAIFISIKLDPSYRTMTSQHLAAINALVLRKETFFDHQQNTLQTAADLTKQELTIVTNLSEFLTELNPVAANAIILNDQNQSQLSDFVKITFLAVLACSGVIMVSLLYLTLKVIPNRVSKPIKEMSDDIIKLSQDPHVEPSFNTDSQELYDVHQALKTFQKNATNLERHELELRQKNSELDTANDNLKTFIRVSSHDMRAPLRNILLLADIVIDDLGKEAKIEVIENIERIRVRAQRLSELLVSLSSFIKADAIDCTATTVDIRAMLVEQLDALNPPPGFTYQINTTAFPVRVSAIPLATVLNQLLDNAIKHHDLDKIHVDIMVCDTEDNALKISIADNGPGIDKHYQDRVFEPFEKLRSRDEVEGAGLGLPLVQKLVTNAGGQLRLESPIHSQNRGCRFDLIWPLAEIDQDDQSQLTAALG